MLTLTSGLTTEFHQQLASPEWLVRLASHIDRALASHSAYHTSNGTGIVFSEYSDSRYMGPNSACKYFFVVDALVERRDGTLDRDRYQAWLRYDAHAGTFRTKDERIETKELLKAVVNLETHIKAAPSKEDVDRLTCPWCGSKVSVQFTPPGDSFYFGCGNHGHFRRTVAISHPPSWWRQTIRLSGRQMRIG